MRRILLMLFCFTFFLVSAEAAPPVFEDTRFQGEYTTENLNAIIEEYELQDGRYWTTEAWISQTFHGTEHPGWTSTAVNVWNHKRYEKGWYGCRWGADHIRTNNPSAGGYGECFGFAQFIGYLLSGERNPQGNWKFYYSLEKSGGLKVGDIVRSEYTRNKKDYHHSAVVYTVEENMITFLQVSGSGYNRISVGKGFCDGLIQNETSLSAIGKLPWLRISRSGENAETAKTEAENADTENAAAEGTD